jgi:drug/metabolite transporter (DMT)-like permease
LASKSGFITALYVPFTPLLGWLIFRQKISVRQLLVSFVALTGLYFLTQKQTPENFVSWWNSVNIGDLWTLATAVSAALHILVTEKFSRQQKDSLALGLWQFVFCFIFIAVGVAFLVFSKVDLGVTNWNLVSWPRFSLGSVFFNAAITTCFAFMMQIIGQRTIGSFKAALIFALEAPFATGFAYVFTGEVMVAKELIGAAVVFLTSIIPEKWLKTPEPRGPIHGPL